MFVLMKVLLVLGAAGGVGLAAVQIGKICGAIVIAVARYLCLVQTHFILGLGFIFDSNLLLFFSQRK